MTTNAETKSIHRLKDWKWWIKNFLPLAIGILILVYLYRHFDLAETMSLLRHGVAYEWLLLSLPIGLFSNVVRGYRWHLQVKPLYTPPCRAINPILITVGSYAVNFIIPRAGEIWRCTEMKQREQYKISEMAGSLIIDRASDVLVVFILLGVALIDPSHLVSQVLANQGIDLSVNVSKIFSMDYLRAWIVGGLSLAVGCFVLYRFRNSAFVSKVRSTGRAMLRGVSSLRGWRAWSSFSFLTVLIWVCYYYFYYITFFAFDFTAALSNSVGFVSFVLSTLTVAIPVPAGIGPWHYAVIVSLTAFGVGQSDAANFALIVHTIQTLWTIIVGIIAIFALPLVNKNYHRTLSSTAESV